MRVLIAEDNLDLRQIFMLAFARFHYDVLTAQDGQEALDLLQTAKPDLLILDINMPRVTGLEVLKQVRARPDMRHLKVIIVTGNVIAAQSPEADEADLLLVKPVSLVDLLKLAERLLVAHPLDDKPTAPPMNVEQTRDGVIRPSAAATTSH